MLYIILQQKTNSYRVVYTKLTLTLFPDFCKYFLNVLTTKNTWNNSRGGSRSSTKRVNSRGVRCSSQNSSRSSRCWWWWNSSWTCRRSNLLVAAWEVTTISRGSRTSDESDCRIIIRVVFVGVRSCHENFLRLTTDRRILLHDGLLGKFCFIKTAILQPLLGVMDSLRELFEGTSVTGGLGGDLSPCLSSLLDSWGKLIYTYSPPDWYNTIVYIPWVTLPQHTTRTYSSGTDCWINQLGHRLGRQVMVGLQICQYILKLCTSLCTTVA